jgi:ribosome biogenesis GTPase
MVRTSAIDGTLADLGWRQYFQSQLSGLESCELLPVRVIGVERNKLIVAGLPDTQTLPLLRNLVVDNELTVTVGDWLLVDPECQLPIRVLERFGIFRRKAAGTGRHIQLIAANVDTLFIITSADADFNLARLERFLTLAREGQANPVIVISKADLHDDVATLVSQITTLGAPVEAVDTRNTESVTVLRPWCIAGQTVAVVGSSGVGKSTLVNTLSNAGQLTRGVRQFDGKGRHTTTSRSMHRLRDGGWIVDTPGMRELQLFGVEEALGDVFTEITELAEMCRFSDCSHESEPGCAVRTAINDGRIDSERLKRLRKLQSEDYRHTASLAERRARERAQGQLYKNIQQATRKRKQGD